MFHIMPSQLRLLGMFVQLEIDGLVPKTNKDYRPKLLSARKEKPYWLETRKIGSNNIPSQMYAADKYMCA